MSAVDINNFLPFVSVVLGGGVAVTLAVQLCKKLFKAEAAHVIHLMVVAVSIVAAAAQYVLQLKGKLPMDVLGISTPVIYGVSQFVYKEAGYINAFLAKVYGQTDTSTTPTAVSDTSMAAVDQSAAKAADEADDETPSAEFSV